MTLLEREIVLASQSLTKNFSASRPEMGQRRSTVNPTDIRDFLLSWMDIKGDSDVQKLLQLYEDSAEIEKDTELGVLEETPYEVWLTNKVAADSFLDLPVFCRANLAAPLDVLVEDFKGFVESYRTVLDIQSGKRKYTERDMERWRTNMVLPYMDLVFWSRLKGLELTHVRAGKILFPNEYDADLTERVRKTVKPLADSLLTEGTFKPISLRAHSDRNGT